MEPSPCPLFRGINVRPPPAPRTHLRRLRLQMSLTSMLLPQFVPPVPERIPVSHPGIDAQAAQHQNRDFQERWVEGHQLWKYDVGSRP